MFHTGFNSVVGRLRDAGIVGHLMFKKPFVASANLCPISCQSSIKIFQKAKYLAKEEAEQKVEIIFYLEHTLGAWVVLPIGFIIATVTFCCELLFLGKNAQPKQEMGSMVV